MAAWFLASGLLLALVWAVCSKAYVIIHTRFTPPTDTSSIDGAKEHNGLPQWGHMPYLLARTQKAEGTITCPPMTDVYYSDTGLGAHAEPTFLNLSSPSCTNINKGAVLVDFTMLLPVFKTKSTGGRGPNMFEFPHPPTIDMRFAVTASDGVDIFFADPSAPVEAISPPWRGSMDWMQYIGGIGDIGEEIGQYVHTHVAKHVQPKKGVFWGFLSFSSHTEATLQFTYSGYHAKTVPMYTKSKTPGVNFGWRITVPSP